MPWTQHIGKAGDLAPREYRCIFTDFIDEFTQMWFRVWQVGQFPVRLPLAALADGEMVSQGPLEPLFQVRILVRQPTRSHELPK